ncbi:hypothetical protein GGR55DRAFT_652256 [Xylaria sp. FL0064]|nr:hypothetical protein GGR55DRAFT_652256 [Xylaria sp. FL0064]
MRFFPTGRWMLDYLIASAVAHEPGIKWLEETELPQGAWPTIRYPLADRPNQHFCGPLYFHYIENSSL